MWPLGVGDWHFRSLGWSPKEVVRNVKNMGFEALEVGLADPKTVDRPGLVQACGPSAQMDLQLAAVSLFLVPRLWPEGALSHPQKAKRDEALKAIAWTADLAQELNSPLLGLWPGADRPFPGRVRQSWDLLVESLAAVAGLAAGRGLKVALEYKPDALLANVEAVLRLLDTVGSPNLGLLLDTGHVIYGREEMALTAEKAGEKLFYVHLDDNPGDWDRDWPPGRVHNFEPFFRQLAGQGYQGALGLDLSADVFEAGADPLAVCQESLSYVKRALAGAKEAR